MKNYRYIYEFGLGARSTTYARVSAESLADAKAEAIAELVRRDLFANLSRKLLWVEEGKHMSDLADRRLLLDRNDILRHDILHQHMIHLIPD